MYRDLNVFFVAWFSTAILLTVSTVPTWDIPLSISFRAELPRGCLNLARRATVNERY